jgi:hypothetical protein
MRSIARSTMHIRASQNRAGRLLLALENPDHAKALELIDGMEKTLEIDAIDLPLQAATDELSHILNKLENNHEAPKVEELLLLEKNLSLLLAAGNTADSDTKQVRR